MGRGLVGVVGATGAVGSAAARLLHDWAPGRLRLGGRRVDALTGLAGSLGNAAQAVAVDVAEPASLARFCAGCHVVVNCAGPSYQVAERVARSALAAGADYVDPGGDDPLFARLTATGLPAGRTAVLSAGMTPGLTGLLPRWLARQGFDRVTALTAHIGSRDRFTPAAAADYLLSLGNGYGEAGTALRGGRRSAAALRPLTDAELPFFPRRVNAYPYLTTEAERLARALRLTDVDWYNVFDGGADLLALVGRLQEGVAAGSDLTAAAADLVRAAELDLFGEAPYQLLVFQLRGEAGGSPRARTLVVRAVDTYRLTALVAALSAAALTRGEIRPGPHYAADVLEPGLAETLAASPVITAFELLDGAGLAGAAMEEGAI